MLNAVRGKHKVIFLVLHLTLTVSNQSKITQVLVPLEMYRHFTIESEGKLSPSKMILFHMVMGPRGIPTASMDFFLMCSNAIN